MPAAHLRSKAAFIAFCRSRGIPLDLRQEGRSLAFATFPVTAAGMSGDLAGICAVLKDHFIEATERHRFHSRMTQLTFSPCLNDIGPPREVALKLSHRPSEGHVFATATLDVPRWRRQRREARVRTVVDALVACIAQVRGDWLADDDRADLMGVFLSVRP